MLYRKSVGQSLHAKILEEVNDVRSQFPVWSKRFADFLFSFQIVH